ncbi:MAG: undecaprenyl/decaprenyl-phosphate alpha-N-acetylglucosaminyl 1-phosphate transferase, partial [Planctomycetota bacterium]
MNVAVIAVILVTVLPAFLVSVFAVGWVARHAQRLGLLDRPNARKVHATPIPLGGGLGIWAGLVAVFAVGTLATWMLSSNPVWMRWLLPENISMFVPGLVSRIGSIWLLIAGGSILMVLGLLDDRFGLDWKLRLLVEFGVASAVVYGQHLQLTAYINAPWLTSGLSVFW